MVLTIKYGLVQLYAFLGLKRKTDYAATPVIDQYRAGFSVYYLPFILILLNSPAADQPLVLVIDGSVTDWGCVRLMVSMIFQQRALPLIWVTRQGKKGHFPETLHVELIKAVQNTLPQGRQVICLGDGEFDCIDELNTLRRSGIPVTKVRIPVIRYAFLDC